MNAFFSLCFILFITSFSLHADAICFESRERASKITPDTTEDGEPSIKCSDDTGAVLWSTDPYHKTVPMAPRKIEGDYSRGEALVKTREDQMVLYPVCGVSCHNGVFPPPKEDNKPRALMMHRDVVSDPMNMKHGKGAIWCLDCHHKKDRKSLTDNSGNTIHINDSPTSCGSCHGKALADWRDGLHGKRTGEWASDGKKRWFSCVECHNPHNVEHGAFQSGFAPLQSEPIATPAQATEVNQSE